MFYLIGIGLKPGHLSLEAKKALGQCSEIYFEQYTSKYSGGTVNDLEKLLGKKLLGVDRQYLEQGFGEKLKKARTKNIALLVPGNPLSATTHVELLLEAKKLGAMFQIIPGISIFSFLGFTGLQEYRFGRTVTIVQPEPNYSPESFFGAIAINNALGLHTLCLLDIKENGKMQSIAEALAVLEKIAKKKRKASVLKSVFVGLAGIGSENQEILAGSLKKLKTRNFKSFPQSIIVCGSLNEKEKEGLKALSGLK